MRTVTGIRDQVSMFSRAYDLIEPMVGTISANQDKPPVHQIMEPAAVLVCLCDALDIDPHAVVSQIQRARKDMNSTFRNEWAAMVAYAKGELL